MTQSEAKIPSGRGRKAEGRIAKPIRMRPEAWAALDARVRGRSDTRGRVIERMLADPQLQPETTTEENNMQSQLADISLYSIQLADPHAHMGGEAEPYTANANARVEKAAEIIGLSVREWDEHISNEDDLEYEIEWQEQVVGKGRRYNVRQWEMYLRRELERKLRRQNAADVSEAT